MRLISFPPKIVTLKGLVYFFTSVLIFACVLSLVLYKIYPEKFRASVTLKVGSVVVFNPHADGASHTVEAIETFDQIQARLFDPGLRLNLKVVNSIDSDFELTLLPSAGKRSGNIVIQVDSDKSTSSVNILNLIVNSLINEHEQLATTRMVRINELREVLRKSNSHLAQELSSLSSLSVGSTKRKDLFELSDLRSRIIAQGFTLESTIFILESAVGMNRHPKTVKTSEVEVSRVPSYGILVIAAILLSLVISLALFCASLLTRAKWNVI